MDHKDKKIQELTDEVNHLVGYIKTLEKKIESLEDQLTRYQTPKNSRNSSIPPSKDENRPKKNQSLRNKSGRKPGGQSGHKGHNLEFSTTPDETISYTPQYCECCGHNLEEVQAELYQKRQQVDIPIIKTICIEHQSFRKVCQCGHANAGQFPEHLKAPIQYGSNVEALVGYFHARQYLPYERLSELFSTCFNLNISQGSIDNLIERLAQKAQHIYHRIREEISHSSVVGSDETGVKINGKKHWIWTWQNDDYTFISQSASRGYAAIKEVFAQGFPKAILNHDAWKPHFQCQARGHQLCTAHLLRDLEYLEKRYNHPWPKTCKEILLDSLRLKKKMVPEEYLHICPERTAIERRLDRLLETSIDQKHKELVSFSKRLTKYRQSLFTFLYEQNVPPDNNASERAIRNVKVKQKISGQFRSERGANNFVTLRSITDTLLKQSLDVLHHLQLIAKLTPE